VDIVKYILYAAIGFIVYLNILASVSVFKSTSLSGLQKVGQLIFSWLIPILGAKFVLHILSDSEPEAVRWIPQRGHGWLIISGVYHESLHGREHNDFLEGESGAAGSGSSEGGGGSD
jgi:hypothetical protein